ncbi:MAG TPA: cache domain-containing protein, partial [Steroidobacteraceae bacterium]|nr:cache domain-containing protein [Steroidobacteraceae bacterium]
NPRVLNYDSRNTKDQDGREYMREMIDLARSAGDGWVEYKNNHPITGEEMVKMSYLKRVGDVCVGCGAYRNAA